MSTRTIQPPEVFIDLPPNLGRGGYTPEPRQWTYFVRTKVVPRMFKAANGGAASANGTNWPYDMSSSTHMGHLPHLPVRLTHPDRRSGLTSSGDALKVASSQRIPPVLVRSPR